MLEQKNLTMEEVLTMSNSFPWKPTFNKVIITLNREELEGMLDISDSTLDEYQFVVAKGGHVNEVTVGQKVMIDIEKLMIREVNPNNTHESISRIKIDPIYVDGVTYAIIEDRFIKAKYEN